MSVMQWWQRRRFERARRIYRFWDGRRHRRVDPVAIFFALQGHPRFNPSVHCRLCDEGDPEATAITCQAVRDVFGVESYDPQRRVGLTLGEQLGLLLDFYDYLEAQKKSGGPSPTAPSSTEASTCSNSTAATTPPSSDCGAACSAPTCEELTRSA